MIMSLDDVISEANAHRQNYEGIGLSDTLVEIVEFAYEYGTAAGVNDLLACIDSVQNFCESRQLKYPARILDGVWDEVNRQLEKEAECQEP